LLGGHGSGDLERHFVRVNIMIRTIKDGCLEAEQRVTGENTVLHLLINALLHRRNVFLGYGTAHHFTGEDQTFGDLISRLEANPVVTELAATTGLTDKLAFDLAGIANRFTVGHLRLTDIGFNVEFTLHAVKDDVQVQLAHTTNDGLAGLFISTHAEGRIFLGQFTQCNTHLFLVSLGFRLNSNVDYRLRELHALQNDLLFQVAQGVTGGHILHTDQSGDIASAHFLDLFTVVGLHLNHPAHTLFLAFNRVDHRVARRQHARVHANECQSTNEGVGSD